MTWGKKFSFAKGSSQRGTQLRGTLQKAKGWSTLVQKRELSWGLAASISTSSCAHWLLGDPLLWITYTLIYQIHFLLGYGSVFFIFLLSCSFHYCCIWRINCIFWITGHYPIMCFTNIFYQSILVFSFSWLIPFFNNQVCFWNGNNKTTKNKKKTHLLVCYLFCLTEIMIYQFFSTIP